MAADRAGQWLPGLQVGAAPYCEFGIHRAHGQTHVRAQGNFALQAGRVELKQHLICRRGRVAGEINQQSGGQEAFPKFQAHNSPSL